VRGGEAKSPAGNELPSERPALGDPHEPTQAPYADRVEDDGRVLIYEGHDVPRSQNVPDPKAIDQPEYTPLFAQAARRHRDRGDPPELVNVYGKLRPNIWTFNGVFRLIDEWRELSNGRGVFKFKLDLLDDPTAEESPEPTRPGA
jgi:hypothetical protein